jgi:hypothetical protein
MNITIFLLCQVLSCQRYVNKHNEHQSKSKQLIVATAVEVVATATALIVVLTALTNSTGKI